VLNLSTLSATSSSD